MELHKKKYKKISDIYVREHIAEKLELPEHRIQVNAFEWMKIFSKKNFKNSRYIHMGV